MKRHKQDYEPLDTIPLLNPVDTANMDSLEAIRKGDAFMDTGKSVDLVMPLT